MDVVRHRFTDFLLSILPFMSHFLPKSSHSPPTQPPPSQTTDLESPPVTTVVARQNNCSLQDIVHGMDVVRRRVTDFLLSILPFMSHLLPKSSHSPTVTTDVARQNIERRNLEWQDLIMGFCFTSALGIALQSMQTPSQISPSVHLLSLAVVFSALFVAKFISSKFPDQAQAVEKVAVFFMTTAFFHAIAIPLPLHLKFSTWAIYVVLLLVVFVCNFF